MSDRISVARGQKTCGVHSLNADIFSLLQSYLARDEFQAFLHSTKHVHGEYVSRRYLSLKRKYSLLYCENTTFRERILSLILDPRRQLAINLSECDSITDVSILGGLHSLDLSCCSGVIDVSMLSSVKNILKRR